MFPPSSRSADVGVKQGRRRKIVGLVINREGKAPVSELSTVRFLKALCTPSGRQGRFRYRPGRPRKIEKENLTLHRSLCFEKACPPDIGEPLNVAYFGIYAQQYCKVGRGPKLSFPVNPNTRFLPTPRCTSQPCLELTPALVVFLPAENRWFSTLILTKSA